MVTCTASNSPSRNSRNIFSDQFAYWRPSMRILFSRTLNKKDTKQWGATSDSLVVCKWVRVPRIVPANQITFRATTHTQTWISVAKTRHIAVICSINRRTHRPAENAGSGLRNLIQGFKSSWSSTKRQHTPIRFQLTALLKYSKNLLTLWRCF